MDHLASYCDFSLMDSAETRKHFIMLYTLQNRMNVANESHWADSGLWIITDPHRAETWLKRIGERESCKFFKQNDCSHLK